MIKLLHEIHQPFVCAGIYVGTRFILGLMFGVLLTHLLIGTLIAAVLASLYFWLLDYYEGSVIIYWIIALAGFVIGLV